MDPREIQSLEELCIQDDAPWCQAACPLHVDVRAMLAAVARGDSAAGAAVYRKKVPFPGILARICDQPCRPVCKREEAGGAIEIGLLERSCAEQAGFGADAPRRAGLARSERIAIVGAGLSGMTAALELARRGYAVKVIEATGQAGGALRRLPAEQLPSEVIDEEVERLGRYGVEVVFKTRVGTDVKLNDLLQQFEAVFVATGRVGIADGTQGRDEELARVLASDIDPVTLSAFREGVFAGGSLRGLPEGGTEKRAEGDRRVGDQNGGYSPVCSIADGLRAAVSIERFLKGESLAAYRDREGPYETRLFTSLEGVEATPPVVVAGSGIGYSADEAAAEAARCLQCQCLECVKACEYLEHFREYPGACIRKVTKNITSLPGKSYRTHTKFINACSLCGLCGAVCPTGLDMAVVNGEARKIMWGREFMPPAIHEFALRDMEASDDQSSLVVRNQPGHESSEYVFFPGCQLTASEPDNVERVYRHLAARLPGGVGLMLGCCGAPAAWSGRQALYEERGGVLTEQWEALGRPRVILACPTCSLMFASGLPDVPAVSLWEVLDEVGLPVRKEGSADRATIMAGAETGEAGAQPGRGRKLAVHDSCTARSARAIQDSVRRLAGKLGYQVEELRYNRGLTKCCSYGGLMSLVNGEVSGKVVEARIAESELDYLTYCSNCRDLFAGRGKPAYHVLDLIFGAYEPGEARPGPTLSERRENRRRLAARMLSELWGEEMPALPDHLGVKVRIPAELATRMERDRILVEDVQQVIHHAETSGDKLSLPSTGRFIAHHRPALVTYWVEYFVEEDEFVVCNAYSHRMQIVDDPVAERKTDGA